MEAGQKFGSMFTVDEMIEIMNLQVIDAREVKPEVDEELVTDFIMKCGYSEAEAYKAARNVAKYDNI